MRALPPRRPAAGVSSAAPGKPCARIIAGAAACPAGGGRSRRSSGRAPSRPPSCAAKSNTAWALPASSPPCRVCAPASARPAGLQEKSLTMRTFGRDGDLTDRANEPYIWLMESEKIPPRPSAPSRLLTTSEVATRLRICPETVRRLHRRNKLKALPDIRKLLFLASAVDDFENSGR
jgi:Helix-turn-helix domain